MQTIKIFVAGSKRLSSERALFRVIASELQSEYSKIGKNINIQVVTFETFDSFFDESRKQNSYNDFIKQEADIIYFILDSDIGGVTEEEFNTAYSAFCIKKRPKICVFSKKSSCNNNDISKVRKKVSEIEQYYNEYTDEHDLRVKIEKSLHIFINSTLYPSKNKRRTILMSLFATLVAAVCLLLIHIASEAKREKEEIKKGMVAKSPEEGITKNEKQKTIECLANNVSFRMAEVPAGSFAMGGYDDDAPKHIVTISNTFYISCTEVTQELWNAVMKDNPSIVIGNSIPVNNISWNDCMEFIGKLNTITGESYRLPTEAEWEYAAQFGESNFAYSGQDLPDKVAWFIDNSDGKVHPVGEKSPNAIGVYDMSGNVWEFCSDYYDKIYDINDSHNPKGPQQGKLRVRRGGSYMDNPRCCQIRFRSHISPTERRKNHGFRLVKEVR